MSFTVHEGRVALSGNLRWDVRDERGVSCAECYTRGFAERVAAALNGQAPPPLREALAEWDRLADAYQLMRADGNIDFRNILSARGEAMENLIHAVRQTL